MSTTTSTEYTDRLDLADLVSRIERQNEETRKFVAEQHKLNAEAAKYASEQHKLSVEAAKLAAETSNLRIARIVTPIAAVVAALGALTAAAPVIGRWLGGG